MNKIVNNFLLAEDKFLLELPLKQPGFNYSACRLFVKHRERNEKFKETGDLNYIYKSKIDQACFAHDASYLDRKHLAKRTISDNFLKDRTYKISIMLNAMVIKED